MSLAALFITSCGSNTQSPGTTVPPGPELGSATLSRGETYQHKFNTTGSFPYKCTIHGGCTGLFGTVVVVGAATPIQPANHHLAIAQGDGGGCFTLSIDLDSVRVGEAVTWTNESVAPHNITTR
jgi:plastocyanin